MTISFSGLASGLDTSSWVESLVSLKQAKVTELEEEKDLVTTTREAVANIKSFFTSFRSVLEKVTDTKFNIGSMDIFAQNLATSSNADILSAIATAEAKEATYEIDVDKLATSTQAVSGYKYTTTIVSTTTATSDSKLINLGVKAGNIGVNVNGIQQNLYISENDTIQTFIDKLNNIGVNASFNNDTGIFNINLGVNDINDIDNTGIVNALHLEGVNEGYQSDKLTIKNEDTIYKAADENTLMSDLGVKAGTLTIEANDAIYNVEIDENTTLGEFIQALKDENINASLTDGTFKLEDAIITNDGTTGLIAAFGLVQDVNSNIQESEDLTYTTVVTDVTTATLDTLLDDIVDTGVADGDTVVVRNSNNETATITLNSTSTLGDLFDGLEASGLTASLNDDGTVTISGGEIVGGTFDAIDAFDLTSSPLTGIVTGNALQETVTNDVIATRDTRLVEDLGVKAGYLKVTNGDGDTYYEKISEDMTIGDLINDYSKMGISASIDSNTGVLTITGGTFAALSDSEVQSLVDTGEIIETDPSLIQGTDLLTKLYGTDFVDNITSGSAHSKSESLKYESSETVNASLTTKLSSLGLTDGTTPVTFDVQGVGNVTVTLTSDMTIQGMISALDAKGISADFDSATSKLTISGATLASPSSGTGALISQIFGFKEVISGKYTSSDPVYAVITEETDVDLNSTLGDIGFVGTEKFTMTVDGASYTTTMAETTTFGQMISWINGHGATASLEDGVFKIEGGVIANTQFEELVGLETAGSPLPPSFTTGNSQVTGQIANKTTELSSVAETSDFIITFKDSATGAVTGGYTFTQDATFQDLIDVFADNGIDVTMSFGKLSFDTSSGVYAEGALLEDFGVETEGSGASSGIGQTSSSAVVANVTMCITPDLTTTFADLGIDPAKLGTGDTLIKNNVVSGYVARLFGTESLTAETTLEEFFKFLDNNGYTATIISDGTSGPAIEGATIKITSDSGNSYLTGALMDALGFDWASSMGETDWVSDNVITYMTKQTTSTQPNEGTIIDPGRPVIPELPSFSVIEQSTNPGVSTMSASDTTERNTNLPVSTDPTIPISIAKTATISTTLATLGVTSTQTITLTTTTGGTVAVTFSTTATIGTIISKLASYDIDASFSGGKITISGEGSGSYSVDKISTQLANALRLPTTRPTGITDSVSVPLSPYMKKDPIISESSLSLISTNILKNSFSVVVASSDSGAYTTITFSSTDTIDDFVQALNDNGVVVSFSDTTHKLTIESGGDGYIYSMDSALAGGFNIEVGEGKSYSTSSSAQMSDSYRLIIPSTPPLSPSSTAPVSQTSTKPLTKTITTTQTVSMTTKLSELVDSSGNNLGITSGQVYVYSDGNRSILNINSDETIESLSNKLANYNISIGIGADGKLYFNGNNNSYLTTDGLTSNVSNILDKLNISNDWSTSYDTVSDPLKEQINNEGVITSDAKLVDLRGSDGALLGITTGAYYIYENGVRLTETITADTTVADFLATLNAHGITASLGSDGSISISGRNNSYIETAQTSGSNSNIVDTLFPDWKYINTYTSDALKSKVESVQNITNDTKFANIDGINYEEGFITVNNNGVKTNISLSVDETIGSLISKLNAYGFNAGLDQNGSLVVSANGNITLENYTGSEKASNALEILGIDSANWIKTNIYESSDLDKIEISTIETAVTRDTKLSELGITSGEYYIYNNGVRYTAMVSADDTLDSFIQTLQQFGIQASLNIQDGKSSLKILGNGDSYVAKSNSVLNASNIVDVLFPNGMDTSYNYNASLTETVTTTSTDLINEDTLLSDLDKDWGGSKLKSEGTLVLNVNGEAKTINITADDTIGSLIDKLETAGITASVSEGVFTIQSGFDEISINTAASSSNLVTNLDLTFHDDLGGYAASSDTVMQTVTTYEERTLSVSNYADNSTKLSLMNISSGSLTIYKDGQRAVVQVDSEETFSEFRSRVASALQGVDVKFENGILTFFANDGGDLQIGTTTDTSNLSAVAGLTKNEDGTITSARELYKVNATSRIMESGLFRLGDVTEGTFTIGNAVFTIDNTTTVNDLISQINSSEDANATAYWDSIDGRLVITSRATGSSLINIESGTSNFTDIMGFTSTEINPDGSTVRRLSVENQTLGSNASFTINGTRYTSTSNTVTSDISRIEGVTINLKDVSEEGPVTLTIERDKEVVADAIEDVIDAYNELMTNVNDAISIEGDLHGETTLKLIRTQLRSLMTSSLSGNSTFKNLDAIGISSEAASGTNIDTENVDMLYFDREKFLEAYGEHPEELKSFLVGTDDNPGVLSKVENLIESTLASVTGYFDSADSSFADQIQRIDEKITRQTRSVERYRTRLEAKFQTMDLLIANMQNQYSSFLSF